MGGREEGGNANVRRREEEREEEAHHTTMCLLLLLISRLDHLCSGVAMPVLRTLLFSVLWLSLVPIAIWTLDHVFYSSCYSGLIIPVARHAVRHTAHAFVGSSREWVHAPHTAHLYLPGELRHACAWAAAHSPDGILGSDILTNDGRTQHMTYQRRSNRTAP